MVLARNLGTMHDVPRIANTNLDNNTSILDDMYDVTAEARHLNSEMSQMLNNISCVSQGAHDISFEEELDGYIASANGKNLDETETRHAEQVNSVDKDVSLENPRFDDLDERSNNLFVKAHRPIDP